MSDAGPPPWSCAELGSLIPSNTWVRKFNSLILVEEGAGRADADMNNDGSPGEGPAKSAA